MINIEIHNNENVQIVTDDSNFAAFVDNKGNARTKFQLEGRILLLGKLPILKDIIEYFNYI